MNAFQSISALIEHEVCGRFDRWGSGPIYAHRNEAEQSMMHKQGRGVHFGRKRNAATYVWVHLGLCLLLRPLWEL